MKRSLLAPLVLTFGIGLLVSACSDDEGCVNCPPGSPDFATSPEEVVADLASAYRLRDIDTYSRLLAPEFVFKFQPVTAQQIGTDSWTRDQDSTGTGALFGSSLVSQISIDVTHGEAVLTDEIEFPPGTMTIRINPTHIAVDQTDGITWLVVTDIQDMFFRPGNPGRGENPDQWFLVEWRDLPPNLPQGPLAVQQTTWGLIKTLYLEP